MFRPVRQVVAPVGRQTTMFRDRQVTKSAVSDCIILLALLHSDARWRLSSSVVVCNTHGTIIRLEAASSAQDRR